MWTRLCMMDSSYCYRSPEEPHIVGNIPNEFITE